MSLAIYAAPFNSDNNELYNNDSQDTPINRKKTSNNKTQKRNPFQNQNQDYNYSQSKSQNQNQNQNQNQDYNSEKVSSVLQSLHSKPSSDSNDLGDFKLMPPPSSVGVENTKIKEGLTNQNNKYNYESITDAETDDVDIQSLNSNYMNDKAVEKYYKNLMPNYNQRDYSKSEYNKPYYPLNTLQQNDSESENHKLLSDKLNYMINLLEDQQDERTNNVTEEVVLYSFLGIFIIFVVDSFARVGKYVR